jgi:DNA repair exonuclease SbcCD ATPase subunit
MPNKQDTDQVRELVDHLNKLRTAAETLEHSQNTLDRALLERTALLDGFKETNATNSSRLNQIEQVLAEIQATVSNLPPKSDLGVLPDSVGHLKDKLEAQQKLAQDTDLRIDHLAQRLDSMVTALQPIEAKQHSLQLDFNSLYNTLLLVQEQIQTPVLNTSIPEKEPDSDQILKKLEGYKTQVNWLIVVLVLQFVLLGGAIMALLTARIF